MSDETRVVHVLEFVVPEAKVLALKEAAKLLGGKLSSSRNANAEEATLLDDKDE